jgi:thioredoxin reductase (NADPH)
VTLKNVKTEQTSQLDVSAVFVFIGQTPNSGLLAGLVPLDRGGHAYVNLWMETELPGLYAAGDVRVEAARQIVAAAGDGATAAIRADQYITEHFDAGP